MRSIGRREHRRKRPLLLPRRCECRPKSENAATTEHGADTPRKAQPIPPYPTQGQPQPEPSQAKQKQKQSRAPREETDCTAARGRARSLPSAEAIARRGETEEAEQSREQRVDAGEREGERQARHGKGRETKGKKGSR